MFVKRFWEKNQNFLKKFFWIDFLLRLGLSKKSAARGRGRAAKIKSLSALNYPYNRLTYPQLSI